MWGHWFDKLIVMLPVHPLQMPYHFSKEHMHLGSGGHKHTLTDRCDPNYVV